MRSYPWGFSVGFVAGGREGGIGAVRSRIVEWADLNFGPGAMKGQLVAARLDL